MLNKYLHQFSNLHCNKLKGEIAPQPFWRLVPFSGGDDTIEMLSISNPYSAETIRKFIRHAEIDNELILLMKDERCREELRKNLRNYWLKTN